MEVKVDSSHVPHHVPLACHDHHTVEVEKVRDVVLKFASQIVLGRPKEVVLEHVWPFLRDPSFGCCGRWQLLSPVSIQEPMPTKTSMFHIVVTLTWLDTVVPFQPRWRALLGFHPVASSPAHWLPLWLACALSAPLDADQSAPRRCCRARPSASIPPCETKRSTCWLGHPMVTDSLQDPLAAP